MVPTKETVLVRIGSTRNLVLRGLSLAVISCLNEHGIPLGSRVTAEGPPPHPPTFGSILAIALEGLSQGVLEPD